uniref:Midasin n=1 Tax=Cacopsylla melanoneura TaxID=428564 RepID=A0A8D8Q4I7_9HEMI
MTDSKDLEFDLESHRDKCLSLRNLLLWKHPSAINLCISYFESQPPPWHEPESSEPAMKKKKCKQSPGNQSNELSSDEDILRFVLLCLETNPVYFRSCWKWSSFIKKYSTVSSDTAKWLMVKCLAIVNQLNEKEVEDMVQSMDVSYIQCRLDHQSRTEGSVTSLLPSDVNSTILKTVTVAGIEVQCVQYESSTDHSDEPSTPNQNEQLVLVKSATSNLQNLALAVASSKPVCLTGPVGCGKTALVHHLAEVTGRKRKPHLLTVQLGEELDAKMLLGSYKCTDIMGEFIWQPGILTQAMMNGYWLLLEDIDSVPSDVLAVFQSLIQNNSLNVPGFKDNLVPSHGFQLFFTQRVLSGATGVSFQKRTPATELLSKLWTQVTMEPMTPEELVQIIQTKFPILSTVASRMVKVFLLFSSGLHESTEEAAEHSPDVCRLTSTRDLMKWCHRVEKDFLVTSLESGLTVCEEALDIFVGHIAKPDVRQQLGHRVAALLGIVHMKADYFLQLHRPTIQLQTKHCVVGRVSLPRVSTAGLPFQVSNVKDNFALTRIASCLIEKIAVCLSRDEPVLLVGETATGKTTTLQLLAQHTNNKLVVINMNQQSDSTDLLGGFKPIDFKLKMKPLRDSFESLFRQTFPMHKNKTFMVKLSEYFSQSNWKVLLTLMINVTESALQKLQNEATGDGADATKSMFDLDRSTKPDTADSTKSSDSAAVEPCSGSNKRPSADSSKASTPKLPAAASSKTSTPSRSAKLPAADSSKQPSSSSKLSAKLSNSADSSHLSSDPTSQLSPESVSKLCAAWRNLLRQLRKLHVSSKKKSEAAAQQAMAFSFIEGTLVKALREGHWILLDEINLASAETLQCLSGLLERGGSVCLYERGDIEPIPRHPNFRLMAAMNPATDVGKKDLPAGLRNRFTELFVDELMDPTDLSLLISCYLPNISLDKRQDITRFYLKVKQESSLADGTGHKPHFSLRTLCRALSIAQTNPCFSALRSLYEAFCLSFITQLDAPSSEIVKKLIANIIIGADNAKQILAEELPEKSNHVRFEGYWIARGQEEPNVPAKYILTPQYSSSSATRG